MKAWQIGARSGIDGLQMGEMAEPVAGTGEILVRVTAAGLNYRDLMVLRGEYGTDLPSTRVPLSDGVGVVEAVGEGVTDLAVGDRVVAPHFVTWLEPEGYGFQVFGQDLGVTADGWLREKLMLPASAAIKLPDRVSDETAATLAVVGGTVWHAMVAFGGAAPGKLVLAQGTGGVSMFALQLAKALGADFAITSSSDEKLAKARDMGADYTINYRERPDWAAALLEATGGRGADVVVDTLGFPALGQTVAATGVNGRIGTLGALSGSPQDTASASQGEIIGKNITIKGIASGSRSMLAEAIDVIAANGIAMTVDREFAFEDAPAAYRHLESAAHMGKVLLRVG
ncbi:NAD(P)-dependent alcohol dehydrogenase [Altererythrobacter sp. GH1-8]|uniref:zinc-dependent alcohol dehydrogenase family protein n=1 Tax=Altererythrobacter sp. GH1-8 TaxID=3349333 RepID=UPI00374D157F